MLPRQAVKASMTCVSTDLDLLEDSQDHLPAALGGSGQAAALALALYCAHRTSS